MEEGAGNSYAMIEPMPDAWLLRKIKYRAETNE
jgi:hypothetical protein